MTEPSFDEAEWLTPKQAADLLGVSVQTARRRADRGEIPYVRTFYGRLLRKAAVEALAAEKDRERA